MREEDKGYELFIKILFGEKKSSVSHVLSVFAAANFIIFHNNQPFLAVRFFVCVCVGGGSRVNGALA